MYDPENRVDDLKRLAETGACEPGKIQPAVIAMCQALLARLEKSGLARPAEPKNLMRNADVLLVVVERTRPAAGQNTLEDNRVRAGLELLGRTGHSPEKLEKLHGLPAGGLMRRQFLAAVWLGRSSSVTGKRRTEEALEALDRAIEVILDDPETCRTLRKELSLVSEVAAADLPDAEIAPVSAAGAAAGDVGGYVPPIAAAAKEDGGLPAGALSHAASRPHRRRGLRIGIPVGIVALVVTGVVIAVNLGSGGSPKGADSAAAAGVDGLRVTFNNLSGRSFAFQAGDMEAAEPFLRENFAIEDNDYFEHALDAGAFVLTTMVATYTVAGTGDEEVIITDVRPTNVKREPIDPGALIIFAEQGGDNEQLFFRLDDPALVALNHETNEPYFENEHIPLPFGGKKVVALQFVGRQYAYTFDIKIEYEIWGEKHEQIVNHNGRPFRLIGTSCNEPYQEIRSQDYPNSSRMLPADPATYIAPSCLASSGQRPESE